MLSTVNIHIIEASGLKDVQAFGRQDPYCIMRHEESWHKTKKDKDAGRACHWNEHCSFPVTIGKPMEVEIRNKNVLDSELIGKNVIDLEPFYKGVPVDCWFPVHKKEAVTGKIHVKIHVTPPIIDGVVTIPDKGVTLTPFQGLPAYPIAKSTATLKAEKKLAAKEAKKNPAKK